MADAEVCSFLTKVLCAHGGRLAVPQLLRDVRLPEAQLVQVLEAAGPERFVLLDAAEPSGVTRYVLAAARVRVCRRKTCQRPCGNLHLCKLNLLRRCRYSERNLCKYSHEIFSEDNMKVLTAHELWGLNKEELTVLLLQNDPFFLPEICKSYKGENHKQTCLQQPLCERLHICEHFTRGECSYPNCLRSHNLMDRKVLAVMRDHGLNPEVVQNFQDICNSKHSRRKKPSAWKGAPAHRRAGPPKGRGQSQEQPFQSREFLSTALLSELQEGPPEEVSNLASKFQHLGSPEGSTPASVSSRVAGVGVGVGGLAERSQQLPEKGSSKDSSSRGPSDADPWAQWKDPPSWLKVLVPSGESSFPPVPSAPMLSPETFQKDEDRPPSEIDEGAQRQPLSFLGDTSWATDRPSAKSSRDRATATREQEKASAGSRASQKSSDRLPLEIEMWLDETVQDKPPLPNLAGARSPQKIKDGIVSEIEIWENGDVPEEPLSFLSDTRAPGRPSARPLHGQDAAVNKVRSWNPDLRSSAPSHPRGPGRTTEPAGVPAEDHSHDSEKDEICLGYLSQGCPLPQSCQKVHFHLPYLWKIRTKNTWVLLQPLEIIETIEKYYCDPQRSVCTIRNLKFDFLEMTCNSDPIRRISTCSSVKATGLLFTTKWIWYWRDEEGIWIEYGKEDHRHPQTASVDSSYLETIYCSSSRAVVVPFQAGKRNYELNFRAMIQTNVTSKTQKKVLRRPAFMPASEMERLKCELDHLEVMNKPLVPSLLSQTDSPCSSGYQLLELRSQDLEYTQVNERFKASMKNFKIDKIKKICNEKLRNAFFRKKMKSPKSLEEILFCVPPPSQLESIYANNFDCASPGFSEHKYGIGSYFTKDALRSHKESMSPKFGVMIVSRVLVGNYIEGNRLLKRPALGYDSCVDSVQNPSIFAIFEKDQIYPQYVVEYSEIEKPCVVS
ncbi:zinc finger CCCH-type antiviral protein 1 isoform X2 [Sorex fumeus]|uniref:zinc finger CCCH-type antiviral protein 1 isoform X2 n=1 Tax=Sorex fumeus TaxID=62283 RepID=UPI0024AE4CEC|nr:zinc finger CCCH-type antiviral protein 1 isoform X2 [Sorex fumeus]